MRFRTIIAAAAVPAATAGLLLTTTAATPATAVTTAAVKPAGTITLITHERGVDDTFSAPSGYTGPVDPTGNGPIWPTTTSSAS